MQHMIPDKLINIVEDATLQCYLSSLGLYPSGIHLVFFIMGGNMFKIDLSC